MRFFTKITVLSIAFFLGILSFSIESDAQCSLLTNFTFTPDSSHSGTLITFTSVVSGTPSPVTYLWDFGDSITSTLQNPTHIYNDTSCSVKTYNVSLTVTDGTSCGMYQANVSVNNSIIPSLQDIDLFTPFSNCDNNPSNSNPNFQITLNNNTADSSMVANYIVNWGDGSSLSTYTNTSFPITHTYTQLGLFNLNITAIDSLGCQGSKAYSIANQGNPAIGLSTLGNTQGCAPQTFQFVLNQYQYNSPGTYYIWSFGDGSPNISWNYNDPFLNDTISHTYSTSSCSQSSNTYSVQVTAYNDCDFTMASVGNIRIYSSPQADFTLSTDTGCVSSQICLTNNTLSGFGYNCNSFSGFSWNFGDPASGSSNTSTSQNACHTYNSPGIYTISLTASNGICGTSTISKQAVINDIPHAVATPSAINGCIPLNANFTNGSYGGNLTYNWTVTPSIGWSFNIPFTADSLNSSIEFNLLGNYNVVLTSTNNCGSDDTTINITTFNKPNVNIAPIPNSCSSFSLTPNPTYITNGSGITSYNWSFTGGNPSSSTQQNPTNISYSTPGSYSVSVIITNQCGADTATQTFTIFPFPNVSVTSNSSNICFGDSVTLTASNAVNYIWSPVLNLNNNTGTTVKASPPASTLYFVTGTDNNGCSKTDSINIIVNPLPILTSTPSSSTICAGDSINLSVSGASTYSWSPAIGLNTTIGASVIANPSTTTTYTVIGTDVNNCSNTAMVVANVNQLPNVTISSGTNVICIGDSVVLNANGATSYSWSPTATLNSGTGASVVANPLSTTTYNVVGTDNIGCVNTSNISITVNSSPIVNASTNLYSICYGETTILNASGASSYLWSPSTSLNSSTASSVLASPNSSTIYQLTGTDNNGCANSDTVSVTVKALPVLTTNPAAPSLCTGDTVLVSVSGANTYSWSPGAGLSSTSGASVSVFPIVTANYSIIGTSNGCVDTLNLLVNVNPTLTISVSPASPSVCLGDSVTLIASGANSFSWSPSTGLSSTTGSTIKASPIVNTTYNVIGSNSSGCFNDTSFSITVNPKPVVTASSNSNLICAGQSVSMTASGANTYVWSPSAGLSSNTGSTIIASPPNATSYIVQGFLPTGCFSTDTLVIGVNPLPTITINPNSANICIGDSVNISASGALNYNWSPTTGINNSNSPSIIAYPTSTTQYNVIASDNNGCIDSSAITVNVNPLPNVSVNPVSPSICFGDSAQLTANGAVSYSWSPAMGLSSVTGASVYSFPNTTSTYSVTGTDQNGCNDDEVVVVSVNPLPIMNINASSDTICLGQSTTLTASGAITYSWTPSTGLSSTSGASIIANPTSTTTYYVQGFNAFGCESNDSITIVVKQVLTLSITPVSPTICIGDSVALTVNGANTYSWTPNSSLSAASGANVFAFPTATTTYSVTGTNINGCINTTSVIVNVNPLPIVLTNLTSATICAGDSVTIIASGATNFSWTPALGLNSSLASTVTANPTNTANYIVTGTDGNACSNTASVMISVNQLPNLNISSSSSSICIGDTTSISVTGANVYSWTPTGFGSSSNGNMFQASPQAMTTYLVSGTDINGCVNTDSISILVNQLPTISVNPTTTSICLGDSVSITATGATSYLWSPSSGLSTTNSSNIIAAPITTSTYTVIGTDNNSCVNTTIAIVSVNSIPQISFSHDSVVCINSTVAFNNTSSGANSFNWDFGNGNFSTANNPTSTYLASGFQTIKLVGQSPYGCLDSSYSVIQLVSIPAANYSMNPDTGCAPLNVQFNNSSVGYNMSHYWNFGNGMSSNLQSPSQISFNQSSFVDTTYFMTLTSTNMCGSSTITDSVIVKPKPIVNFGLSSNFGCSPLTVGYSNITTGLATSYLWDLGNGVTSAASIPSAQIYTAGAIDSIYTISLIANNYCGTDTLTKQITVRPQSVTAFFNPSVYFGCAPLTVNFSNFSTLNSNISWDFDDGNFSTAYSPTNTYLSAGTYHVKLYVSDSCSADTAHVTINVSSFPILNFTATPDTVCVGEAVNFTNQSTNLANVIWKFGDANTSVVNNPTHNYLSQGLFEVTLIGTAQSTSCVDSIT
ncbi:PKD domain-containing protein, partial [Bacteroidota bacterium]